MDFGDIKILWGDKVKRVHIIAFTVLFFLAYFLIVKHDIGTFAKLSNDLFEAESNLRDIDVISKNRDFAEKYNKEFALKKGAQFLIELITNTAKDEGIEIDLVRPLKSVDMSGYRKIRVLIEGKAVYHNLGRFVSTLENSEKHLFIEDFNMRGLQADVFQEENAYAPIKGPIDFQPGYNNSGYSGEGMGSVPSGINPGMMGGYDPNLAGMPQQFSPEMAGVPPGMYPPEMVQQYSQGKGTATKISSRERSGKMVILDGAGEKENSLDAQSQKEQSIDKEMKTVFKLIITGFRSENES